MQATQLLMQTMANMVQQQTQSTDTSNSEKKTQSFEDLMREKQPDVADAKSETVDSEKPETEVEITDEAKAILAQNYSFLPQSELNANASLLMDLSNSSIKGINFDVQQLNMSGNFEQNAQGQAQQSVDGEILAQGEQEQAQTIVQTTEQSQNTDKVEISTKGEVSTEVQQDGEVDLDQNNIGSQLFKDVKTTPVKVGETQVVDTSTETFDANLAKAVTTADMMGAEKITLQLSPASLGNVTIEMSRTPEGVLNVIFITETDTAAKLINEHSSKLGALLLNTSTDQVKVEVQQSAESEQGNWQQQQDNPNRHSQGNNGQGEAKKQEESNPFDFMQRLRLGLEQNQVSNL